MTAVVAPILGAINGRTGREYDAARLQAARPLRALPAPPVSPEVVAPDRLLFIAVGLAGGVAALLIERFLDRVVRGG